MIRGADFSSVQGDVPYETMAPEIRFVIAKCYQGNDGLDPKFRRNIEKCIETGRVPGAYFFAYPLAHLDPRKQAELWFEKSKGFGANAGELPPFIDLEWPEVVPSQPGKKGWREWGCSPQQLSDWQAENCRRVEELWGRKPILYLYDWWWACVRDGAPAYGFPKGADVSWAKDYDLWMAWYRKGWPQPGDAPKVPAPFQTWRFWQFDGNGGLKLHNGVDSDFCVFNGSEEDLRSLADGCNLTRVASYSHDLRTVRGVQMRLIELGYTPGAVDGAMGPRTLAAIKAFQLDAGLTVDGIVGPKTRAALA